MNIDLPKATEADICLLLEGTFPFVLGGVSTWIYQLIQAFPNYRFAAIFLGGKAEDYDGLHYPLPPNLVHLEVHYLFDEEKPPEPRPEIVDKKEYDYLTQLHDELRNKNLEPDQYKGMTKGLVKSLIVEKKIDEKKFLFSKESWNYILASYEKNCPGNSFIDYFWAIRNMHRPIWKLIEIAKHVPNVKVFHSISTGYAGFLGTILQSHLNKPFILSEHGIYTKERWIDLLRKYWIDRAFYLAEHGEEDSEYIMNVWIRFFESLGRMCYAAANPIISLFEAYRQRQIADGADPSKTRIIPNAIDLKKISGPYKTKPNQENPIICFIGRIVPIKDLKTFIRMIGILAKQHSHLEAWIVGSQNESPDYVEECKNLVNLIGLDKIVKFMGEQKVADILPKIDLLVLNSISEGLPIVILEAFAAGVPVVATDVGDCRDLIYGSSPADKELGAAGEITTIANPKLLAEAVWNLLNNTNAWQAAQKTALQRVKEFYNFNQFVAAYAEVYREVMA